MTKATATVNEKMQNLTNYIRLKRVAVLEEFSYRIPMGTF
jgi:hypothetical protein